MDWPMGKPKLVTNHISHGMALKSAGICVKTCSTSLACTVKDVWNVNKLSSVLDAVLWMAASATRCQSTCDDILWTSEACFMSEQ
jgi:hypothetical protein